MLCEPAEKREKAAEKGGTPRGKIQNRPEPLQNRPEPQASDLCLGITRHPCDKTHAVFVRQASAAGSCKKMGR